MAITVKKSETLIKHAVTQLMSRELLQQGNLDAPTLISFLNDTILLNSVLRDAGIKTPGERLKIILTLKPLKAII